LDTGAWRRCLEFRRRKRRMRTATHVRLTELALGSVTQHGA
jgi:hypothetical protein